MDADVSITPHADALALIKNKPPVTRAVFDALLPELRARVFMVSGLEAASALQRVRDAIAGLPAGKTWDETRDDVIAELDPFFGDASETRATLLVRTHGFQAFQAANYDVIQQDDDTTHMQYLATEDDRVRDSHLALNGIVLPKDDPFWDEHYPPWEWNCRCRVRGMNSDQVEEERKNDEQRDGDNQLVLHGAVLKKLRDGHLQRDGRTYDVSADPDPDAFHWHPTNLRIPVERLKARYDPDTWKEFEGWSKQQEIQPGLTVWDWLHQAAPPAIPAAPSPKPSSPPPASPAPAPASPVPPNSVQEKLAKKKFKAPILDAAARLNSAALGFCQDLLIEIERADAFYRRSVKTIFMSRNPDKWFGTPQTFLHETGHHLHFETGVITGPGIPGMKPEFHRAMEDDWKAWQKRMATAHPNWQKDFAIGANPSLVLDTIAKDLGLQSFDSGQRLTEAKRISRIADTVLGLSWGDYGAGHLRGYMRTKGHMEVYAHAFAAAAGGDADFQSLFTNVSKYVKDQFGL